MRRRWNTLPTALKLSVGRELASGDSCKFVESPHGFDALHWDLEPDCGGQSVWCPAFRRSGPAKAGTPNRRFMESPVSFFRMHWDHEPADRAAASWTAPVLWRFRLARLHRQSARRLENWRTPKPGGASNGSWRAPFRFFEC